MGNIKNTGITWSDIIIYGLVIMAVVLVWALTGCGPKIMPPVTITKDSTSIVYRDTTITLPGRVDSFIVNYSSFCDSLKKNMAIKKPTRFTISKPASSVTFNADSLGAGEAVCNEDAIRIRLENVLKEYQAFRERNKETVVYQCENGYHKFSAWAFPVLVLMVIGGSVVYKNYYGK